MLLGSVTQIITDWLLRVFRFPELVTVLISVLPVVEARGAVPVAFDYGISPPLAFLYAFVGSSLAAPLLIAFLLPFVRWLSRTKLFKKAGETLYEKFEKKSRGIAPSSDAPDAQDESPKKKSSGDLRRMLGVFAFVAVPLPLTGVWTGSAVAAIVKLPYPKALLAVVSGNLVATSLITLLCALLPATVIDYVILAIGIVAVVVVAALIVKILLHKSPAEKTAETEHREDRE